MPATSGLRRRWLVAALAVATLAAVLTGGAYLRWRRSPPPLPTTMEQAVQLVNSRRFARLPEPRRDQYLQAIQRLIRDLPPRERRAAWQRLGPAGQHLWLARARAFATASPADRTAMLDAYIALTQRLDRSDPSPDPARPNQPRDRLEHFLQHGDPQDQAFLQEFFKALRHRRTELGLP